jgi:hypothetical protein
MDGNRTVSPASLPIENLGPHMNIVVWVLVGLSGLFLGLRIYCKFMKSRGLWWDDYLLIASWVSISAYRVVGTADLSSLHLFSTR